MIELTNIWKINNTLVVAKSIEEAILIYKTKDHNCPINCIEKVTNSDNGCTIMNNNASDELLEKLPSHIGRNPLYDSSGNIVAYTGDDLPGDIGWLYLHNDGKYWRASYGEEGDFVCLNPKSENPPYNNAVVYGTTPSEALQKLYDWCKEFGFIQNNKE